VSRENLEIVERLYGVWAQDEFPAGIDLFAADVEYVNPPDAVEPGTRRGIAEFMAAVEKMLEGWESWRMKPERLVPVADKVAVVVRYEARARASGIEVDGRESALLTLRDGKIVRYEWFHGPDDALIAVGVEE
jgi:ketosteroid isomerase-like protein